MHSISLVADRITSGDPALSEKFYAQNDQALDPKEESLAEKTDRDADVADEADPFTNLLDRFEDDGMPLEEDAQPADDEAPLSAEPEPVDVIEMDEDWAEDMEKAGAVQDHLLGDIPQLNGVDLAIEYQPYSHIGGDFYQVVRIGDERTFFILGDVSGHGVQAALIVSSIVNSLKIILRRADEVVLS